MHIFSEDYSIFCSCPQLKLVVKFPSDSTLIYSPSMTTTLLEGWDLSISMVINNIICLAWYARDIIFQNTIMFVICIIISSPCILHCLLFKLGLINVLIQVIIQNLHSSLFENDAVSSLSGRLQFLNHKFSKYVQQYTSFSCIWCLHLAIDSLCKGQ